ncbi:hypothetical protein H4219_000248 [Mycoemilia scoparia]|uniref:Uncharacterized protein n=1 Tax=Mycoemilia scoparia TaxID=417184 RepID=A0A9W8AB13_9FUNG|nr:hypothetical protein H4219_000248 [Mycoemilia scoparia]
MASVSSPSILTPNYRLVRQPGYLLQSVPRVPSGLRNSINSSNVSSENSIAYRRSVRSPNLSPVPEGVEYDTSRYPATPATRPLSSYSSRFSSNRPNLPPIATSRAALGRRRGVLSMPPPPRRQQSSMSSIQQRPLSTQSATPRVCLSFNTDDGYEIHTYKTKNTKVIKPSRFRGWLRKVGGEFKYSLGTFFVSSRLITSGNRDITQGMAQMNLCQQSKTKFKGRESRLCKEVDSQSTTYSGPNSQPTTDSAPESYSESQSPGPSPIQHSSTPSPVSISEEAEDNTLRSQAAKVPPSIDSDTTLGASRYSSPTRTKDIKVSISTPELSIPTKANARLRKLKKKQNYLAFGNKPSQVTLVAI